MRIETEFDDDLRERPVEPERLREAIAAEREDLEALRKQLDSTPEELERTRLGRVLNRLGDHLRLAGDYEEARRCCEEAVEIWRSFGRDRAAFLASLRRARVDFAAGELERALEQCDALVERSREERFEIYRDFPLELRGRTRAANGSIDAAVLDLRACLRLRRDRDRTRLAERTERLIEILADRDLSNVST